MRKLIFLLLMLLLMITSLSSKSSREKEISKTFKGKKVVEIRTASGDCKIKKGKENRIDVRIIFTFDEDHYKPEMREEDDILFLSENFKGHSSSGNSEWIITVPDKTDIKFKSASGDFSIDGLISELSVKTASGDFEIEGIKGNIKITTSSGDLHIKKVHGNVNFKSSSGDAVVKDISGGIEIRSASGDIEARRINGEFIINTSSGDMEIEDSKGRFIIKSVSGEIDAENIILENESSFKTVSGEISVKLSESSDYDLYMESSSGNVVLDYNGKRIEGSFEFLVRKDKGEIISPIGFDEVDEYNVNGKKYIRKCFKKGSNKPVITLKTHSGDIELRD